MSHRLAAVAALLLALALPSTSDAAKQPKKQFYVNLGDSYATGYQPKPSRGSTNRGYANQLVPLARKRGYRFELVNFGCGGATTASLLKQKGCRAAARAKAGRAPYKGTQIKAAETFLKANRKRTGLITVSISGNDVTKCAGDPEPVPCVTEATESINTNLKALLERLRKAAGPKVRIVGTTYPDVILGEYLKNTDAARSLAALSQVAFENIINPALKTQYEAVDGKFVDVTKATGGYDDLASAPLVDVEGSDAQAPQPVATICELTWYCELGDIHARASGYRVIAKLIAKTLPKRD